MIVTVFAVLAGVFLVLGLLLPLTLVQKGETHSMKDTQSLVFEIYRYGVCFVMVLGFTILSYVLLSSLLSNPGDFRSMGGPALGVLLSVALFFTHWRMKNPAT